jgi:hypothetical protein
MVESAPITPAAAITASWTVSTLTWLPTARFVTGVGEMSAPVLRQETLAISAPDAPLETIGKQLMVRRHRNGRSVLLEAQGCLALVELRHDTAVIDLAAERADDIDRLFGELSNLLGATEEPEDSVEVAFWAEGHNGPRAASRRIAVPTWTEIADNYATATSEAIARLADASAPEGGRLILWTGPPGTGKTYAARALCRAWKRWCSAHIITDPEAFLGAGTSYLLDVLTARDRGPDQRDERWKLVILEDAGELLALDAHNRTGQALSRLLNVTDGMIGQGMNAIVLVTTNEPVGKLHPAIQRPGRCWRQIEFAPVETSRANKWIAYHDSSIRVTKPTTLTDLYAILRGTPIHEEATFGFGAA